MIIHFLHMVDGILHVSVLLFPSMAIGIFLRKTLFSSFLMLYCCATHCPIFFKDETESCCDPAVIIG